MVGDGEKGGVAETALVGERCINLSAGGDAFGSHSAAPNENDGDPPLFERSTRVPIRRYLDLEREGAGRLLNL